MHARFEKKKLTRSTGSNALGVVPGSFTDWNRKGGMPRKISSVYFFQMMWLRHSQKTLVSQSGLGCLLTTTGDRKGWGWWWPTERSQSGLLSSLVATLTPSMPASVSPPLLSATVAAAGLPESTAFTPILLSCPAKQPHIQLPLRSRHLLSRFLSLQILWMTLLQMKQVMLTSVLMEQHDLVIVTVFFPAPELILYF